MALVSVKRDREDDYPSPSVQQYPYGLEISLDDDTCKKLGINSGMKPGTEVGVKAVAIVTRSAEALDPDKDENGTEVHLCLQITDLEVTTGSVASDAGKKLYGSD